MRFRRPAVAALGALAAAGALPAGASAHAVLQHTTPHQSSSVEDVPTEIRLDFNEPVEVSFGAVRVFDSRGQRVDSGKVGHPANTPKSVVVAVRPGLGSGVYTTTYRVVSADGHPVSGGFAFGVGTQVRLDRGTPQVADLLARSSAGPFVEGFYGVVRGSHYAALLLLIGAIVFRLLVWRGGAWPGRLLAGAAGAGLVCSLLGIVLQGALGAGVSFGAAFASEVIGGSLDTRAGHAWLVRAFAWAFALVFALLYRSWRTRWEAFGMAVPVLAVVATLPYGGHADTQSPRALLIPADVVHVLAAGAWLGGLVLLVVCFWPRGGSVRNGAPEATARFSRLALPAMAVLVVAGTAQAWFLLGSIDGFFSSTYGWALLAKIGVVVVIIGLAATNRRRVAQRLSGGLRGAMLAELGFAVLVLGATATLVRAAPSSTLDDGPVVRDLDLGPMRLQFDLEPAVVGPNDYHLYLFDRRTGAQIDRVEELSVRLVERDKEIGPITVKIPRKGPAHYELRGSSLGVAGRWDAVITARVSKFDELSAKTSFEVRKK